MLTSKDLEKLSLYKYNINRARIRYSGIGPYCESTNGTHGNEAENQVSHKIWPRDTFDPHDQTRMILLDFKRDIEHDKVVEIEETLNNVFERLRLCNVNNLYKKHAYHPGWKYPFKNIPFVMSNALDADTPYHRIAAMLQGILRSINVEKKTSTNPSRVQGLFINHVFGCNKNLEILKGHIDEIIRGCSKFFVMRVADIICYEDKSMDLNIVPWLDGLELEVKYNIFTQFISAIMRYLLEFLRRYFYITRGSQTGDKLFYYGYDIWQRIKDDVLIDLTMKGVIARDLNYASISDIHPLSFSKLRFHLKNSGLRPICIGDKKIPREFKKKNDLLFAILEGLLLETRYCKFSLNNLLEEILHYKDSLNSTDNPSQVYIVRTDIKDCFQSVKQDLLYDILEKRLRIMMEPNNNQVLLKRISYRIKVRVASDLEESKMKYISKTHWTLNERPYRMKDGFLVRDTTIMNLNEIMDLLEKHIKAPTLVESYGSKHGYKLLKGIRQGSSFSPMFSNLYIQSAFEEKLMEFLISTTGKIFRYVDDILFISTDLNESQQFMYHMLKGIAEYDIKMNINKLSCNFTCRNLDRDLCRIYDYAIFYKQRIWLKSLECQPHYDTKGLSLHYTTGALPYTREQNLLSSIQRPRLRQIHLDTRLNSEDRLISNIFEISLWLAHRIGTTMLISYTMKQHQINQTPTFLVGLAKQASKRIWIAMKLTRKATKRPATRPLTRIFVSLLVFSAFICTWQRDRLRHRRRELNNLLIGWKRFRLKVLLSKARDDEECKRWVNESASLMKRFPHSDFYKLVRLFHSVDKNS